VRGGVCAYPTVSAMWSSWVQYSTYFSASRKTTSGDTFPSIVHPNAVEIPPQILVPRHSCLVFLSSTMRRKSSSDSAVDRRTLLRLWLSEAESTYPNL